MKSHLQLFLAAAILVLSASCKKTNTQGRYIPATAAVAVHINGESLSKKLPWATVKTNPIFKQMYADSSLPETLKKLMDDPETSGIDVKKDLIFFVEKDSLGGYLAFEGSVKDEAAFKNFNNSFPDKGSASEADGVSFISRMPICVGWTKEKFVYVIDAPKLGQMDEFSRRMKKDSIDITDHGKSRDINATCKAVFALKEGNSLGNEEKFTTLMGEPGDLHFWMNAEELSKSENSSPLAMISLDKFIKGSVTTAALTFNEGKINISTLSYSGEDLTKLYKKYAGGKIDDEMLKRIPGNDVIAAMALNLKPEGIKELLEVLGVNGIVNAGLTKMGSNMNDLLKGTKGDIAIGLTDLKMVPDTAGGDEIPLNGNFAQVKPSFNFVFATSINEKESFNKIVNAGKSLGNTFFSSGSAGFNYSLNDKYFALANTKEQADKYLAGTSGNYDWIPKINGEPFGAYVNFQTAIKAFEQQAAKDSAGKIVYDASLQFWDNLLWKGGTFKNGGLAQNIEINLKDKNTNSLQQINSYAAKIGEARALMVKKQKEDLMAFEDAVTPAAKVDEATTPKPKTK